MSSFKINSHQINCSQDQLHEINSLLCMHCYATNLKPCTYKDQFRPGVLTLRIVLSSRCSNTKDRIAPGILTLRIVVPSVLVQVDLTKVDLTCYPCKEARTCSVLHSSLHKPRDAHNVYDTPFVPYIIVGVMT